jgi:hypothetical protein
LHGSGGGGQSTGAPRRGRWSQAEIARLRELYGLRDDAAIARELNRPVQSVKRLAAELFRSKHRTGPWTAQEVQNLKKYLGVSSAEVIARILGREVAEVRAQIEDLGRIQHDGVWTREEVVDFKRIYGTRTDEDLARIFGRGIEAVRRLAEEHKLAKDKAFLRKLDGTTSTRMPRWTEAELEKLRAMYADHANLDIASALDRSVKSVVSKAHNLGLKKDSERLRAMGRENVSLRYSGHPT